MKFQTLDEIKQDANKESVPVYNYQVTVKITDQQMKKSWNQVVEVMEMADEIEAKFFALMYCKRIWGSNKSQKYRGKAMYTFEALSVIIV